MKIGKISGVNLQVNASGKLNRNDNVVKSGCGVHKSKKDYSRKQKHKKSWGNDNPTFFIYNF